MDTQDSGVTTLDNAENKGSAELPLADNAAGKPQGETSPLTITIVTDTTTLRYSRQTVEQTLSALRSDILQRTIPKDAKTAFQTKTGKQKPRIREGTLIECASLYGNLAKLYTPVRQHAFSGMMCGIVVGILIHFFLLGLAIYQVNQTLGLWVIALPICLAVSFVGPLLKIVPKNILGLCMLGTVIIPGYLGLQGIFFMMLGAAFAGGILWSMPGMSIGAAVGTVRRRELPLAYDAPHENAALRIAIPLIIGAVVWIAYIFLVRSYLPVILKMK